MFNLFSLLDQHLHVLCCSRSKMKILRKKTKFTQNLSPVLSSSKYNITKMLHHFCRKLYYLWWVTLENNLEEVQHICEDATYAILCLGRTIHDLETRAVHLHCWKQILRTNPILLLFCPEFDIWFISALECFSAFESLMRRNKDREKMFYLVRINIPPLRRRHQ